MNTNNTNSLKELKLWLCASLKNSEAQLICDSCSNDNDINNKINKKITELEELKIILMTDNNNTNDNNNDNNNNDNNNKRCGGCDGRDRK